MSLKKIGSFLSFKEDVGNISAITKALDDMDVKTARTAVNATKWSSEFKGLAINSSKHLDMADDILDIGDAMADVSQNTSGLGNAFTGLFGVIKAHPFASFATAAAAAGLIAYNVYKNYKEGMIESASEITSSWKESTATLEEQRQKYIELRTQLSSGTLDETETYNTKMQILDIQQQISSSYGDQVSGIDLVNGTLSEQLALLDQISVKEAQRNINESKAEYKDATNEMTKDRHYTIGWAGNNVKTGIGSELKSIVSKYKDVGLSLEDAGEDGFFIKFSGDAAQASETINSFMNDVTALKQEFSDDDQTLWFLDNKVLDQSSRQLNENKEILDSYQDNYKSFLEMEMLSQGMGENDPATLFNKYTDAVNEYNQALAAGDASSIEDAALKLQNLQPDIDSLLSSEAGSKYSILFEEVGAQLEEATIKAYDFDQALSGNAGKTNQFKDKAKDIKELGNGLKELELDGADVINALTTAGAQAGESIINSLADAWGINAESSAEDIQAFSNALIEAGIVSGSTGSQIDALADSFANTQGVVESAIADMETLNSIMSESTSGSGISKDSVAAFRSMFGADAEKALERTANGYHLNKQAVAELQSQQESLTKVDILSQLSDQYEALRNAQSDYAKAATLGQDTSGFESTISGIESNITALQDLQLQYEAANSAYSQWQSAMSGSEEGDMYDSIQGNLESAKELYDQGLVGTSKFKEFADLMSNQDLSNASVDQIVSAYESAMPKIERYFTEGSEGAQRFLSDVQNVNSEWAHMNDDGSWEINFGTNNDQEIADALGIDVEAVQSILRKLSDYGFDIDLDQPLASLDELKSKAEAAKEALSSGGVSDLGDINLNADSLTEVTDQIAIVEEYINELNNNEDLDLGVKTERLEDAAEVLDYLVAKQDEITSGGELSFTVNMEELDAAGESLNAILESKNMKTIEFDFEADIDGINDQINDVMIVIDSLRDRDGTLDINAEGVQEAQAMLQGLLAQKELLSAPEVMQVDTSALATVDADMATAITKIQEFQNAVSNLNILEGMKSAGIDVDTTAAQQKVQELAGEISGMEDARATLGLDTAEFDGALASITGTPIDVQAGINLDRTQLDAAISGIGAMDLTYVTNITGDLPKDEKKSLTFTASIVGDVPKDEDRKVTYAASITNKPSDLSRTLTYNVKINGSAGANGTANVSGTAFSNGTASRSGHAFNSGDWAVPRTETALLGELGTETIVRNGKFFTVGENGAGFTDIRKGDIIFNHRQTEELFKNGHVTSGGGRGKLAFAKGTAFAQGSAFSSGSGSFWGGASSSSSKSYSSSTSTKSSTSTSNNAAKTVASAANATEDALKQLTDYFNWVAVMLDYANKATQKAIDAIETAVGLANKQTSTANAIAKTQEEMSKQSQAYDRYMSHATWFAEQAGLGVTEQTLVQNGSLDIYKYDDDTKTKIEEYQKWLKLAQETQDAIDELKKQEQELALQRLENIEEYYDAVIAVYDATKSANEAKMDLYTALGNDVDSKEITDALNNSIKQQESTYSKALQQLADYQNEFNDLVAKGYIQNDSDAWYEGQKVIQDFTSQVDESATALIELQNELREIDYTKLQQTIDRISTSLDRLQNGESLKEKRDERMTEAEYLEQLSAENSSITTQYALRNAKLKEQSVYAVNSTEYNRIAEEIAKIDDEIYSSLENIEDLKDAIFELRFADFYDDRQSMEYLIDDLDVLRKLLNDDAFVDSKTGALTGEGLANIALIGQQMAIAKQEIAEYTAGIKKLDGMLKSGLISTAEYEEKQREFLEAIQDSAIAVSDYRESLINLYIEQLEAENNALQESISLRKKALKATKDYYDYADSINSKSKDVNAIKAQIAALTGVTNSSAMAELKRLQAELVDAEKSLADTKSEHEYTVISNGYDEMSDDLNQILDDTLYSITYNSEKQEEVVSNMLNNVVGMYSEAYGTIQDIISGTGIVGTTDFNNSVNNIGSSSGASNIASDATQSQGTITSGDTTNSIITGNVGSNTSAIENNISTAPNTDNRPVAELTISNTSVSLEEGKSTSISVGIRPTDAKNKTIAWISSNTSIATVSNGTIKAVTPGSATITASTTDGSGLSKSCGVTVTAKPAPVVTTPSTSTQGDGAVQVGDRVTFTSGRYYYDSYGQTPAGSRYMGSQVYITKINSKGSKPYHISTGSKLGSGDLGWLTQSQIAGYYTGTKNAKDGLAFIDDTASGNADPGSEVIMTKYGALRQMNAGDHVFSKAQTAKLWELSKNAIDNSSLMPNTGFAGYSVQSQDNHSVNLHFDAPLINIENAPKDVMDQIKGKIPELTNMISIYARNEVRKS